MNKLRIDFIIVISTVFILTGCATWNNTSLGTSEGTMTKVSAGLKISRASDSNALKAITEAAVGGASGAVIGRQMDKQAEEIKKTVPNAKVERFSEGIIVEFGSEVLFAFDKSNLSVIAKSNLDKLAVILNSYPETNIQVQGHTDNTGSEIYNQTLSEERARSVSVYLSAKGVTYARLKTNGFGENIPKYSNNTAEGSNENRRIELMITANEKMKADARQNAVD